MAFVFLHTADWQLGKPFGGFDAEKQALLRRARLEVIDALAAAARKAGATDVLVAGDVYDGNVGNKLLLEPLGKLGDHDDITWHLLPGNHDPAIPGEVWDRISAAGPPANVVLHLEPRPHELQSGVVLLPAPLKSRNSREDPTAWMDDAETRDGTLRIGLAHGSVHGFDAMGEAAIELDRDRAARAGLCYLGLGDWHGLKQINERTWYSGTPEPDRFKDNDPGQALIVRCDGAKASPQVEGVATAAYDWRRCNLAVNSAKDLDALHTALAASPFKRSNTLLRLELTGAVTLAEDAAIARELERLEPYLFHLRRRMSQLHVVAESQDLDALGDADLRAAAQELQAIASGDDAPRAATAEQALRLLFQMAIAGDERSAPESGGQS